MIAFKNAGTAAEFAAIWSILALAATLAVEARRGRVLVHHVDTAPTRMSGQLGQEETNRSSSVDQVTARQTRVDLVQTGDGAAQRPTSVPNPRDSSPGRGTPSAAGPTPTPAKPTVRATPLHLRFAPHL